ncbi:MAG: helix-turn-helix transcriptional regulator [Patescibacteria group bacterium]
MIVNNRLRELRKNKTLTQEELGKAVGVTRQTIISIENQEYIPTTLLSLKIAKYFKVRVEEIFWL